MSVSTYDSMTCRTLREKAAEVNNAKAYITNGETSS
jgi:hypothetical protein